MRETISVWHRTVIHKHEFYVLVTNFYVWHSTVIHKHELYVLVTNFCVATHRDIQTWILCSGNEFLCVASHSDTQIWILCSGNEFLCVASHRDTQTWILCSGCPCSFTTLQTEKTISLSINKRCNTLLGNECYVGRDSSVGIAATYGLDGQGIESRWVRDFPHPSRPALGPPSLV